MDARAYIGIDGKARKVRKIYIGIDGVARRIKKAYIGVGGIARLLFSGGELSYYETDIKLSQGLIDAASASVGSYALFAGGRNDNTDYKRTVYAYDASLTEKSGTLSTPRAELAGTSIGNYALFAGGLNDSGKSNVVDTCDASLTTINMTKIAGLAAAKRLLAGARVGDYALFAGGMIGSTGKSATVDAYNSSLTEHKTIDNLSAGRYRLAGVSVGNYALFAGGTGGSDVLDAYDTALTRSTFTLPHSLVARFGGTNAGDYALLTGGSKVYAYDASLTARYLENLSISREGFASASVGGYAIFAGGYIEETLSVDYCYDTVDAYDEYLIRTILTSLSRARHNITGGSVGDYAIFVGGQKDTTEYSTIDVYLYN